MGAHEAVSLLVFAIGAFAIPLGSGRLGFPAAVGEILFGIVVGPHLLGWIEASEFTTFLAEFGFAFLMFLVGLELDIGRIERLGWRGVGYALAIVLFMFGLALGLTLLLGLPLYLFLVFGAISLGVVMVTLNEAGMTKSHAGQTIIFVGSLGEFITIVLLTGFGIYYRFGLGWGLAEEMGKLGLIFVAAYVVLVILRTLIWWWPASFVRVIAHRDPTEVGVRAAMAAMLVFVALATLMGVESILGSFVAGTLFSFVFREKRVLEEKMSSLGFGFFVPLFFIWVGTEFDLSAVMRVDILPTLALLFGALLACKVLGALPLYFWGLNLRQALGAGLLLGTPLTLLVVIARLGLQLRIIDQSTAGAIVVLAIVTAVIFPWAFRRLLPSGHQPASASTS